MITDFDAPTCRHRLADTDLQTEEHDLCRQRHQPKRALLEIKPSEVGMRLPKSSRKWAMGYVLLRSANRAGNASGGRPRRTGPRLPGSGPAARSARRAGSGARRLAAGGPAVEAVGEFGRLAVQELARRSPAPARPGRGGQTLGGEAARFGPTTAELCEALP